MEEWQIRSRGKAGPDLSELGYIAKAFYNNGLHISSIGGVETVD
jgi:hypothetical protein